MLALLVVLDDLGASGAVGFAARLPFGTPADRRGDVAGDRFEQCGVVLDAELAGDCEEDRVGCLDGCVLGEFVGDLVGFSGVGAAEAADCAVEPADLVVVCVVPEETLVEAFTASENVVDGASIPDSLDGSPVMPSLPRGHQEFPCVGNENGE